MNKNILATLWLSTGLIYSISIWVVLYGFIDTRFKTGELGLPWFIVVGITPLFILLSSFSAYFLIKQRLNKIYLITTSILGTLCYALFYYLTTFEFWSLTAKVIILFFGVLLFIVFPVASANIDEE